MTNKESMAYLIDWELNQEAFRRQIRDLIQKAKESGKVLPIAMEITKGTTFVDQLTLLISQVNCEGCEAPCCKHNPNGEPMDVLSPEYQRLAEKYGSHHFIVKGKSAYLPMPCPFLKNNRCTIYRDRPLACVLYPFQPGASDGAGNIILALASSCPEARRIVRSVYMMSWRIRQQFYQLGEGNFMKGIF